MIAIAVIAGLVWYLRRRAARRDWRRAITTGPFPSDLWTRYGYSNKRRGNPQESPPLWDVWRPQPSTDEGHAEPQEDDARPGPSADGGPAEPAETWEAGPATPAEEDDAPPQPPAEQTHRAGDLADYLSRILGEKVGRLSPEPARLRHLSADFPARVTVGDVASLIVRIRLHPDQGGRTAPLRALNVPPQGMRLNIVAQPSPALEPLDRLDRELLLPYDGDSDPVRFPFRARSLGLHRVNVTVWAGGTFAGELTAEVSAEAQVPATPRSAYTAPLDRLEPTPGEATLQVRRSAGGYMFQLMTPYNLYPPVTESLAGDPAGAVERTIATLQSLASGGGGYSGSAAALWLREAGVSLWNQMVPQVIKEQFWEERGRITAFNIATDQDIVPWELLYPLSPAEDEGFLVEQFPVMRRVYGQQRVAAIAVQPAAFVLARDAPPEAHAEVTAINQRLRAVLDTGNGTLVDGVESLLTLVNSGGAGLLHFACHNRFEVSGGGSSVRMADGDFTPMMLTSAATGHTLATGPLVFLNACRSAGAVYEYTRLTGWASGFMAAGAGAFVGTLWAVPSGPAREFAEAFYDACLDGRPIGRAMHAARIRIRRESDPTWLAYTAYGDPAARVAAGPYFTP
ncbi:CHAT domain-containing protein [Actinoallomurus iriomotensis]|uniref:CHAT domain-containing protein n=1 Tax=Actinoallomurus iriomotensis TaxID=478107 RepID=UPI002553EB2D|nr:CHAT domain-containing protein [Actinoallomurus iriomotensis]